MLTPRKPMGDHKVGYCMPPLKTRFVKGQSGNPKGRPKKEVDLKKIYQNAASAKVTVRVGNQNVQMTKIEAAIHTNINKAARGDLRSLVHIINELQRFGIGLGAPEAGTGQVPVSDFYASLIERALLDRTISAADEEEESTDKKDDLGKDQT